MAKDQEKAMNKNRTNFLSILSVMIGLITLLSFLVLIVLGQYMSQTFEQIGEYIFLSIPIVGIIGVITGLAAYIQIREGVESTNALKFSMAGIFISLITLIIFLLIFWLV